MRLTKPSISAYLDKRNPLNQGLRLAVPMNEGAGKVIRDLVASRGNSNFVGNVSWATSPFGSALSFAPGGADTYISFPNIWYANKPASVSYWQKRASGSGDGSAFGTSTTAAADRFQAHSPYSDNILYWDYGNTGASGRISTSYASYFGAWHHIVLVSSGPANQYMRIYIDGVLVNSTAASNCPTSNVTTFSIGQWDTYRFTGQIANFCQWDRPLTGQEAQELYVNPFSYLTEPNSKYFLTLTPPASLAVTRTHTSGSLLKATLTRTYTSSAFLSANAVRTHTTGSLLKKTQTKVFTTSSLLRATKTRTHTASSYLSSVTTRTHTSGCLLWKTQTSVFTSSALLKATLTRTHTTGSYLVFRVTRTATSNALLRKTFTRTNTTGSLLHRTVTKTFGTSAALWKTITKSFSTSAYILNQVFLASSSEAGVAAVSGTLSNLKNLSAAVSGSTVVTATLSTVTNRYISASVGATNPPNYAYGKITMNPWAFSGTSSGSTTVYASLTIT